MASITEDTSQQPPQIKEPTIIFLFDLKNWTETISPLTKLDIIDIAPLVSTQFYLDSNIKAYILILTKGKWDSLSSDTKRKFMIIARRVKEEMEGPMTTVQRDSYENADIFVMMMAQPAPQPQSSLLEAIAEEDSSSSDS